MGGWIENLLDTRAQRQVEKQRRLTLVEVLRNLPDRGVVDEHRADGSRTLIYIQLAGAGTK